MFEDAEGTFQLRILLQLQPAVQPRRFRLLRRVRQDLGRPDRLVLLLLTFVPLLKLNGWVLKPCCKAS